MKKKLIVNADDFGLTPGVNRGILEAFQRGIVTSATLMTNMPGFPDAVALARQAPGLAVGLHLNLTYGRPLLPAVETASLLDEEGRFVNDPAHILEQGRIDEMLAEFKAQARRFLAAGIPLSHLDTHHHLHRSRTVMEIVAGIARELGVTVRCLDPEGMARCGLEPKARYVDGFWGRDGADRLLGVLHALPGGVTEIPCHPGYDDAELRSLSPLNADREWELKAVTDPLVVAAVAERGILLTSYRDPCLLP